MYSRGAGKSGRYSWVPTASGISDVSYVAVQLWEPWRGREFRSIPKDTARHYAYRFAHISWQRLLYVVSPSGGGQPETISPQTMQISRSLQQVWNEIGVEQGLAETAINDLLRRKRGAANDDDG
jgi:hypothetical protein